MTGVDTYWESAGGKITLLELLEYTSEEEVMDPKMFESLLPKVDRKEERISNADLSYPIIVTVHSGEYKYVLDGQHRLIKAIRDNKTVKVRSLDFNTMPKKIKDIFS